MRKLSDDQIRAIHAKAASRGRVARFFVRNPGVKQTLKRAAVVGLAGAGLAAIGFRNRRLIRAALQEELPGLRATLRHVRKADFRRHFLRETVRQEQALDLAGKPHLAAKVWAHRKKRLPPRASKGLEAWMRAIEHRIRGVKAEAVGRARSTNRMIRYGGIPLAGLGGPWALIPAVEDLERWRGRREAAKEPGFVVVTKRRKAA